LPQISRIGTGTYQTTYCSTSPGVYSATVIYDENKVVKQRIDFHEKANARCSVIGNIPGSVQCGEPSSFTIQSLDMHGNLTGVGGDLWEISIILAENKNPSAQIPLEIVDQRNGKYVVKFTLETPGLYNFSVLLEGENAKKSPFKVKAI